MAYEHELAPLRAWLAKHPGLTVTALKKTIQDVPWPAGPNVSWAPPYDGTRLGRDVPSIASLDWKLRYLELLGDARQERGKWWLVLPNVLVTGRGTHDPGRDTAVRAPVDLKLGSTRQL